MSDREVKGAVTGRVLVTGGASGIGEEITRTFAAEGWDVLLHYNTSEEKAGNLREEALALGVDCVLFRGDLSLEDDVNALADKALSQGVLALVNNAGTCHRTVHFSELTMKDMEAAFAVNVYAPALLSGRLFGAMKKKGFGRIVNISSIAAKYGGSGRSMHYGCSKLALEGVTNTLAREGAGSDILVNTVRPGVIDTDFHRKFPKDMARRIEMIPMKRTGTPRDIAGMVYYLGSGQNRFITGETITVAGGE